MVDLPSPPAIYQGLIDRGFNPAQAAALTGNIQQESNFNPAALNQGEGANGLLQWRLDRWQALQDFAKARGTSPTDVNTQLDFIGQEMRGSEAKSAAPFLSATDLPEANAALKRYIRYGDNSQDARLKYASAFIGGQAPQAAPQTAAPQQPAPVQAAQAAPTAQAPQMPAFGWSPQQQQPQQVAQSPTLSAPQMVPINYAPRKPPDLSTLQALLQNTPAQGRGFSFYKG